MSPTKKHVNKSPNYKSLYQDEQSDHLKTSRELMGKAANEVRLIIKIEQQQQELEELKAGYTRIVNLECKQCLSQEKLCKEVERLAMYPAITWTLLAVIIIIIVGSLAK